MRVGTPLPRSTEIRMASRPRHCEWAGTAFSWMVTNLFSASPASALVLICQHWKLHKGLILNAKQTFSYPHHFILPFAAQLLQSVFFCQSPHIQVTSPVHWKSSEVLWLLGGNITVVQSSGSEPKGSGMASGSTASNGTAGENVFSSLCAFISSFVKWGKWYFFRLL